MMRPIIIAMALSTLTAGASWACSPPDWRPGDVIFDGVPLQTIALPQPPQTNSLLGWARRGFVTEPDAKTRFRVVEYFRGGGEAVIEVEHLDAHGRFWFADCLGRPFVRGERVFVHAYYDEGGALVTRTMATARGEHRQRHLEWARSPRFWLEGSSPYDETPEPPEPPAHDH